MHMKDIQVQESRPLDGSDDDGAGIIRGLALGLGISLLIWLVPLTGWLLLR